MPWPALWIPLTRIRVLSIRRPFSVFFTLLYLLLSAGGEALQHGGSDPATAYAESHLHAPGDSNHDCPPPPHDENHCPACKLSGLRVLPTESGVGALACASITRKAPGAGDEVTPARRTHALPASRAPPLG
ncbi:MAG TPA: hypothetical protein VLK84_29310 [Longimicrobium sp.]|nr:hypothetical protein [Longimicrobium sp.]